MKLKIEIKLKYVYGFLALAHIWVAFFIGSVILPDVQYMPWYFMPYVLTNIIIFFTFMTKAMNAILNDD